MGDSGFGQAQPGSIIVFNDSECNFFSPADKYAFYEEDGEYVLEVMGLLSTEALTFTVEVEDEENIEISGQSTVTKLKRVE